MTRYLFDTGSLTDYVNRREPTVSRAASRARDGHRLGVCPPVLGEFYGGLECSDDATRSWERWRKVAGSLSIWPFDHAAAKEFGRLYAELRRLGRPMQQVDVQLAAVALTLRRCVVVSKDTDLLAVPDLTVENWAIT